MITKKTIAAKLLAYLQHETSLAEVVAWAEQTLIDADYNDDPSHHPKYSCSAEHG